MHEGKQAWKEKLKSFGAFFTNKKTVKGARITYSVVWNMLLLLIIVLVLGGGFAAGTGAGYFASLVKDEQIRPYENMRKDIYNYEETSDLYFDNDVYLGKLRTDLYREEVKLDDMSKHLVNAVVATEDEYFYEHDGVVPKAIMRALFQEVTNSATSSGGSTLTQQLIKNQILTNEISFERKAKEILLALRLEKFFDKKEILEAYLNVATFGRNANGSNIAGVQAAAQGIFGKEAKDLTLPQAAFIAGLPQSPFGYTPFSSDHGKLKDPKGLEPGLSRYKTVVTRMHGAGFISDEEFKEAINYDITKDFVKEVPSDNTVEEYPFLTFEIEKRSVTILAEILAERDGYELEDLKKDDKLMAEYQALADRDLRQNGYKIYTTINKEIYEKHQETANKYPYYGSNKPQEVPDPDDPNKTIVIDEQVEIGAVLIENKTGKMISFVGGRDFDIQQRNHATDSPRQNGSTMKPLLVYAPAMELGKLHPGSVLPDVQVFLNGPGKAWPNNYDMRYSGLTSARHALTKSYNVPAVLAYKSILNQRPATFLDKMGFSNLHKDDYENPSTSIGSLSGGVTVEENTNAFGTFANGGKFIDAYMIEKIVDKDGNVVFQHKSEPVDVFSPQTSYLTIDMMRDVINRGTATAVKSRLKFGSDWAGKTGTGHDFYDSWFVATNPNVSFGVWLGYDHNKPLEKRYKGLSYGQRTQYIWADLMNDAYDVAPQLVDPEERFKMPGGIVKRSYCGVSGLLPSSACSKAGLVESDYFIAKYAPSKVDDSLVENKFVTVGDKRYIALDSTPSEFTDTGVILNPEYMESIIGHKIRDPQQLIPKKDAWNKILVADDKLSENGKTPAALGIKLSGKTITWGKHPENDIVGYRIYNNKKKVGSIKAGADLAFNAGDGSFYVTAVDIAGKESKPSNIIEIGQKPEPKDPPKEDKPKDPKPKDPPPTDPKPKDPPKPPPPPPPGDGDGDGDGEGDGNGDGNGNGNGN
ncbi:transglycosylase domain-containing protein [Bacillus sp. ISL-37]|uniref:transglycosylase domain-containing protein n=1 Tax=Bacillus sp. ISL-37 TaxID=2819123 RepID=UPI001BE5E091|nr:transglycosylase domain-containing protein [Bacillus sp. ISL-37]MBT2683994.1 penicillin-binding protein [Bacillus sp. ISL-37]